MSIEGNIEDKPPMDLLNLRETDLNAFLNAREARIRIESGVDEPVMDKEAQSVLESYQAYVLEISKKRPLLSKIYSCFKAGIKEVAPIIIGAGVLGGITAWMTFSSGGPVYPDAIIISCCIGGVIGHVLADHDRVIRERERTNKLILSTQE